MSKELMDCRNRECPSCSKCGCGANYIGYREREYPRDCDIYKRLLPLWEYQDRFESKTETGSEVHILKVFPVKDSNKYYACGYVDMKNGLEKVVFWSVTGKGREDENLIPKSKSWYGVVDQNDNLMIGCTKDHVCPDRLRVIKLKEDKD